MNRKTIDIIESSVKITDILSLHGIKHYGNRCVCPFCKGHGLSLSYTNEVYHCFACEDSGSVIQLEAHLSGISMDEACNRIARSYGLDISYKKPSTDDLANEKLNRKLEDDYKDYKKEQKTYYKGLTNLYRGIWNELQEGGDAPVLSELETSLSEWLDDNIAEVNTEWTFQLSPWATSLMEQNRSN